MALKHSTSVRTPSLSDDTASLSELQRARVRGAALDPSSEREANSVARSASTRALASSSSAAQLSGSGAYARPSASSVVALATAGEAGESTDEDALTGIDNSVSERSTNRGAAAVGAAGTMSNPSSGALDDDDDGDAAKANGDALAAGTRSSSELLPLVAAALPALDAVTVRARVAVAWGSDVRDIATELTAAHSALMTEHAGVVAQYLQSRAPLSELDAELGAVQAALAHAATQLGASAAQTRVLVGELRALQTAARHDQRQLDHRSAVQAPLAALAQDVLVPPNVERALREDKVDAAYLTYVQVLDEKLAALHRYLAQEAATVEATQASALLGEEERAVALMEFVCARAHRWLAKRLAVTCADLVQWQQRQAALVKYRRFYSVLAQHRAALARDVAERYAALTGALYAAELSPWLTVAAAAADRDPSSSADLLGASEYSLFSFFGFQKAAPRPNLFSLETRKHALAHLDYGVELPSLSVLQGASPPTLAFELLFRGVHFQFSTLVMKEARFAHDFFAKEELLDRIFERPCSLFTETAGAFAAKTYDVLSLLILTIVVQKQAQMVRQIVAPATLARYFDALLALLAARAQVVLGEHVASLDAADSTSLKDVDVARRFAELFASVAALEQSFGPELRALQLATFLEKSQSAALRLLDRLSLSLSPPTQRYVYMINNLDMIHSILLTRGATVGGYAAALERQLAQLSQQLLDASIKNAFPDLIRLYQPLADKGDAAAAALSAKDVEPVLRAIAAWHTAAEALSRQLHGSVASLERGSALLAQFLELLCARYSRLHDATLARHLGALAATPGYLPPNELRYATKKFAQHFMTDASDANK